MTATARVYAAMSYVNGSMTDGCGSLDAPINEATLNGTGSIMRQRYTVAASVALASTGNQFVYDSATDGAFQRFWLAIIGSGYCYAAMRIAKADGSMRYWVPLPDLSCGVPLLLCAQAAVSDDTAAHLTAESGGFPALWTDATVAAAVIEKIAVRNTSTTATVVVERSLLD